MANKKLKILYLAQYFQQETDEQHPKTLQDIIAHLESHGISAERKSIYDDMELLRLFGMDIQSVKSKNFGYFLGDRDFELPELKLLIDVVQASPFLTKKKSMELISKLEQLTSRYGARQLRRQVYVMNRLRTVNETLYYTVDGMLPACSSDAGVVFFQCTGTLCRSAYCAGGNCNHIVRENTAPGPGRRDPVSDCHPRQCGQ